MGGKGGLLACALVFWSALVCAQAPTAPRFDIQRFLVEGNSLLPQDEVDQLIAPFIGPGRDFGDIQRALEAMQEAYLSRGYNAVRVLIPEQDLAGGQVRLQVIESRLRSVRVEGNRFFDEANVRASLPSLIAGEAPNTRRIGENVQLANENPVKQTRVVLESTEDAGKVDAVVRVTDDNPQRVSLFLDNTGNSGTGYYRAGVGYQNANMRNQDEVLTAQVITSPTQPSDVLIAGVGYRVPMYKWNGVVDVFAGYSDVNSGTVQGLFAVTGAGSIYGARYTQVLPRVESYEHRLAFGWDYRAFRNNVNLVGTSGTLVPDITIQPLSLTYTGRLPLVGKDFSFYGAYSWNVPAGGTDGDQQAFSQTRAGAEARYDIWRAGAAYSQLFPGDVILRATLNAQWTRHALVPGEQFGLGGVDNVRGYFEREVAYDKGNRAQLELYGPDLGATFGSDWRARILAFIDMGSGRDNTPVRNAQFPDVTLGSNGIGLRMNRGKSLSLRFDWAHVTSAAGTRDEGSQRLHFAVSYTF